MPTLWESFINKYKDQIPYIGLSKILEAYFYWCNNHKKGFTEKADKIMGFN